MRATSITFASAFNGYIEDYREKIPLKRTERGGCKRIFDIVFPRIVNLPSFSWKKRNVYGTILQ